MRKVTKKPARPRLFHVDEVAYPPAKMYNTIRKLPPEPRKLPNPVTPNPGTTAARRAAVRRDGRSHKDGSKVKKMEYPVGWRIWPTG